MTSNIVVQNDEIISVGELNKSAKYLLENNFNNVSLLVKYQTFQDLVQGISTSH